MPTTTFEQFAPSWLATWAAVCLKPSGYREYETIVRLHLIPAFVGLPLDEITPATIQRWVAHSASTASPRSVRNRLIVLKKVLGVAVDYGLLFENPVDSVAWPRIERAEMRFLEPEQLQLMIDHTPRSWRLLTAMAALTGLRKSSQLALLFSDIDIEAQVISVSKAIRGGVVTSTKTGVMGSIPVPGSLIPLLEERRARVADPDALVFSRAGKPIADGLPNRILATALADAGLPQVRWHGLRHSWVVAHLKAGTSIPELQRLGLWRSPDTLLSVYAHVTSASGGDAVRRLDDLMTPHERR